MKKRIISISITLVLTILSLFLLFTKMDNKVLIDEDTTIDKTTNTIKDNSKKDTITINDIEEKNTNKDVEQSNNPTPSSKPKTNQNTNSNNTPAPVTPTTPTITYSCPDGFNLQGETCYQSISATLTCPNGLAEIDAGCINLSGGNISEDDTCPNGYYLIKQINWGAPDIIKCILIESKIYTCPDGYNLNNSTCTKSVPATRN